MAFLVALCDTGIVRINRLSSEQGRPAFQRGFLLSAKENGAVAIAYDRFGVVLVDTLKLALRL
jgi:hypothetical protein